MFFRLLGNFVARFWPALPLAWLGLLAVLAAFAPDWRDVITDGDFQFLPAASPSRVGQRVFAEHFDKSLRGSNVLVVARRDDRTGPRLTEDDRRFVDEVLALRIRAVADRQGWTAPGPAGDEPLVAKVSTSGTDPGIGPLLDSRDGKATLVRVGLTTELTERRNDPVIDAVQGLIDPVSGALRREGLVPAGLELYLSGPAAVAKDMRAAAADSAKATERATVLLVVALLILIYRAPILALVPLATVAAAVKVALCVLALLAEAGAVTLFHGSEIYVTVVMYGAGVDYCMFLMARYKEELDGGRSSADAVAGAIAKSGEALAASAGTVIVGIGMMVFAEFGRFRQAGVAMSLSLVFVLLASLTFAPALLRAFGRWAFWPRFGLQRTVRLNESSDPAPLTGGLPGRPRGLWARLADSVVRRPAAWWAGSAAAMLPLAVVGIVFYDRTTYGLLDELPRDAATVRSARAVERHFPAGESGPVGVLIETPRFSFAEPGGITVARELTDALWDRRAELSIADIRSLAEPYGKARPEEAGTIVGRRLRLHAGRRYYVGGLPRGEPGRVMRVDVVFQMDPFSPGSLAALDRLEQAVRESLPREIRDSRVYLIGSTASIRDLRDVTHRDQIRTDLLVLAGVYAVLMALLRQIMIAAYLIVTVFFSYLVTLGATFATFWALNPGEFAGLDWKVPMFLFTILVAVGEDYNIFLVARVEEEQRRLGGVAGIREALARTGGIISGCGVIMAGTFSSLMFGSLAGMVQLGFALAFGVILDTFVVRPILVPAYLVLLNNGRFGAASRWLGAYRPEDVDPEVNPPPSRAESATDRLQD